MCAGVVWVRGCNPWAGLAGALRVKTLGPGRFSCVQNLSRSEALSLLAHMAPVYGVIALGACRQSRRQSGWSKSVDFGRREPWRL